MKAPSVNEGRRISTILDIRPMANGIAQAYFLHSDAEVRSQLQREALDTHLKFVEQEHDSVSSPDLQVVSANTDDTGTKGMDRMKKSVALLVANPARRFMIVVTKANLGGIEQKGEHASSEHKGSCAESSEGGRNNDPA